MGKEVSGGESGWVVGQPVVEEPGAESWGHRRGENRGDEGNTAQGPLATPQCSLSPNRSLVFQVAFFEGRFRSMVLVADRTEPEVSAVTAPPLSGVLYKYDGIQSLSDAHYILILYVRAQFDSNVM